MRSTLILAASLLALGACGGADDSAGDTTAALRTGGEATDTVGPIGAAGGAGAAGVTALVRDSAGRELGTVTLADAGTGIAVNGTLRGLPPGAHGFHIHTTGQCEPTFEAAGGHWNPTNAEHGTEVPGGPHLGDLPNVTVAADSTVTIQATTVGGSLRGESALLDADGAAVMVHSGADDYRSQPSGDAGSRIACGAVGPGA